MRRDAERGWWMRAAGALAIVLIIANVAAAQWVYPGGYRGYGWSRWGADPGAGYMAGLGSFARGEGSYLVDRAKADAIERDSLIKWNKALMAQRRVLQAEKAKRDAQEQAIARANQAADALAGGYTLNDLLERILETDPVVEKVASSRTPVPTELIRAIPFETATEPISLCLDQLTRGDAWPGPIASPEYNAGRAAVGAAVQRVIDEDARGPVSDEAAQALKDAIARLREQFVSNTLEDQPGYADSELYLRTLSGLTEMLKNPVVKKVLDELETYEGDGTIGDLITFMHSFNLRFGPAQDDQQRTLYQRLAGILQQILVEELNGPPSAPPPDAASTVSSLRTSAQSVFQGMSWDDLNAGTSKGQP